MQTHILMEKIDEIFQAKDAQVKSFTSRNLFKIIQNEEPNSCCKISNTMQALLRDKNRGYQLIVQKTSHDELLHPSHCLKMKRESMRDYKLKQTTNNLPRWLLYCFLLYQMPTQANKGGFHHTNEVLFDMIKYIVQLGLQIKIYKYKPPINYPNSRQPQGIHIPLSPLPVAVHILHILLSAFIT